MITTIIICLVAVIANNCATIHPDLNQLIPDMNATYPLQQVSLQMMQCQDMYSNMTLMKLCFDTFGAEIDP